jgi:hypothetical protein
MRIKVSNEQIWMARVHLPRSTAEVSFRSPLVVLPLAVGGGGGGSGIGRATLERLRLIHLDQRCSGEFRTPLAILPLMGGGGSGIVWRVKWGPLLSCRLPCRTSPSATCIPLNHATGPVLIGCSLALLGFVPIGRTLALSGFGGCRVERFNTPVAPRREIQRGTAII